jgi:membrane protease YdiL (CAAX protease family)
MPIKLTEANYKLIGIAVLLAIISFAVSQRYFRRTFPEASLELRVDRVDSESIARKFLQDRGLRLAQYRHTAIFTYDNYAKLYLERTVGLERLNQLTTGTVHLWRWSNRWFRPQQQEEFSVDVTPAGEVVRFSHVVPENLAGKNLDAAAARPIAEAFLIQTVKHGVADLELVESEDTKRPARTDHVFTWKQKNVPLGDGSLRISVWVDGDQVSGYSEFVKVPENWSREYERLRSRNDTAQAVDQALFSLLTVAMVVMLILRLRNHDVPFKTAAGFALTAAIFYFLSRINNFPLAESGYSTTASYSSFVASYFTFSGVSALGVATFIFFLVAAAEPEYRASFPRMVSLRRYCTWRGLRTRSFFLANVVGLALAAFFFAYQTIFYFCANKLGAWAPSDIPFTNDLNTRIPWMGVLFMGFFPAVSEEMQFRAFAVPFLAKLFRSLPLAIILAAFNWGFLHSAYPNEPFFIRGLEVGLGGILIGIVMLRFGIVATLIWHYSVDALYSAFLLLRSPNHYLMASGAITAGIMVIPLGLSLIAYLKTGTFADDAELTNAGQGPLPHVPKEEAAQQTELAYCPLSRRRLVLAGVLTFISLAIAAVPAYRFGTGVKVKITAQQASQAADAYLRTQGIDPGTYRRVPRLLNNVWPSVVDYFVEHVSVKKADQVYRGATQMLAWEVRYFRPLEIEEHRVLFDASNGSFVDHRLLLDENASGVSLDSSDARSMAEKAAVAEGFRLSEFELQNWTGQKRKARQDYRFVWQAKSGDSRNVAEEKYRVAVDIAGNKITSVSDWFNLPEEWQRQQQKTGLMNSLLGMAGILLGLLIFTRAIVLFVQQVRHGHVPWRAAAPVAAVISVVIALHELNSLTTIEQGYNTSIPFSTFWLQTSVGLVVVPILSGLGVWLLVALALSFFPHAEYVLRRSRTAVWRKDAAVAIVLSLALAAALNNISIILTSQLPKFFLPKIDLAPGYLETWSPAVAVLFSAISSSVLAVAALGVLTAILRSGWSRRNWWLWAGCLLFLITLGPANAHSVRQFVFVWTDGAASLALAIWVMTSFFRDNVLAYLSSIFCILIAQPIVELLSQDAGTYQRNGLVLAILSVAILGWLLLPAKSASQVRSVGAP